MDHLSGKLPAHLRPVEPVLPSTGFAEMSDLTEALAAGWRDFLAAPLFGLFFAAVYVAAGWALIAWGAGALTWTLTVTMGFPLVAPFAAVGLYEVSRRREAGERPTWGGVLGVILAERGRQVPWLGAIVMIAFLFWSFFAHMLFALIMGMTALRSGGFGIESLGSPSGQLLVLAEAAVGALFGLFLFGITVVSLPMCLDREVDFVTAMLLSLQVVANSPAVMITWALMLGLGLVAAMLPGFLGLLVALPVFGHASWHLYRRVIFD